MNRPWDREEIFFESKHYFSDLESGIASAEKSIEFETYIFDHDALGTRIAESLKAAAARGVYVRVLVDGFGSPDWVRHFLKDLTSSGVEARVYHPMPLAILMHCVAKEISLGRFLRQILTLNERNHRKTCIIDHRRAWTGGMNVSTAHMLWRDTGVFVEGVRVQNLSYAFNQTWRKAWHSRGRSRARVRWQGIKKWIALRFIRLNSNRKMRRTIYRDLLRKISRAKHRVWITNAYFVPPRKLRNALRAAAMRGVNVKILVPRKSDVFFMRWVSSALYCGLLSAGVRIYEYLPAPLHAKTLIIDDWATIGTTNLNHRSIIHDLEVDVVLSTQRSILELKRQFAQDLKVSEEVSRRDWARRPWKERVAGRILLFFRYWI